jgi:MFS family permease
MAKPSEDESRRLKQAQSPNSDASSFNDFGSTPFATPAMPETTPALPPEQSPGTESARNKEVKLRELTRLLNSSIQTVGAGPFQLAVLVFGGGVYAAEGSLLLMLSIIGKGLIIRWNLSPLMAGVMASVIFSGIIFGTATGGFVCDRYGRRLPILVTYCGISVFIYIGIMMPNLLLLLFIKFMLGCSLGFGVPAANAMVAESCPPGQRSNIYCMTMVLFSLGQLYSATIVWIMSPEIKHDEMHWRGMLAVATLLPVFLLIGSWFFLPESPHWLLVNWRINEARDVTISMVKYKKFDISERRAKELEKWITDEFALLWESEAEDIEELERDPSKDPVPEEPNENTALVERRMSVAERSSMAKRSCCACVTIDFWRLEALFSPQFARTTIIMTYITICSNFAYYGMIYGLPDTLKKAHIEEKEQYNEEHDNESRGWTPAAGLFFSALSEIPGVFIAIILAATIGRRKNMSFAFFMCASSLCLTVYALHEGLMLHNVGIVSVLFVKLFLATGYIVVYLYLLECYPTTFRATGLAFCMVLGRTGAFAVPFLYDGFVIMSVDDLWFFVIMSAGMLAASIACCFLPYETKDAELQGDVAVPCSPEAPRRDISDGGKFFSKEDGEDEESRKSTSERSQSGRKRTTRSS